MPRLSLFAPHEEPALWAARGQRVERRLMRALVEELRLRLLLGPTDVDALAVDDLRDARRGVVHVADEDGLDRADHDARRFKPHVYPVRAEIALLGGVVFGVDEDGVVGAGGHARLAADADGLVEIDDAIGALEHRGRGARRHAGRVRALVAARHLMRASSLRECPYVHVLDVGARHGERDEVLGLAGGRAGVAADAARLVDDLAPARRRRRRRRPRQPCARTSKPLLGVSRIRNVCGCGNAPGGSSHARVR